LSGESVEEYLEAIYFFNEKGELAKTTEIAKRLKVAPPSVTQMIKRLAEEGLVEHKPYKGATLTGKGTAKAQKVVRKHRLLERFLHDYLGFNSDKVHEEACKMEHSISDDVSLALCKALDKPETCPDDEKPIPPCPLDVSDCTECDIEGEDASQKLLTELSNLKPGEKATVAFVRGGRRACQRLLDMGLTIGTVIEVVNAAPFKGPLEINVRGTNLALGRGLAGKVFVELENDQLNYHHPHGPRH
jgi:DtxR family Mn-dependent transcriptional regulator